MPTRNMLPFPGQYKFPLDDEDDYRGYIDFSIIRVIPPTISFGGGVRTPETQEEVTSVASNMVRLTSPNYNIRLYLHQGITFTDGVEYDNNVALGIIGATAAESLNNASDLRRAVSDAFSAGVSTFTDLMNNTANQSTASFAINRLINSISNERIAAATDLATRTTVNPNKRTIFRAVQPRAFNFSFKMIASSAREAQEIENIIKVFREEMYPDVISGGNLNVDFGYKYPDLFNIRMSYNGQRVGTDILPCYLGNVTTVINPSSMGFHEDGKPSEVDLTLTFYEERPLDKRDIRGGY